jgi:TolB-like protein
VEVASVEKMAFPLPDKPSIAVLPFVNMSEDPKQEYFSDGITEDLITDLSQISGLFVIGRNSTFAYKGKPIKTRQVAEELGVRYVLEGSVRKADKQVRINAQLIDATTGGHLWAQRYDGKMGDVFALQDKITGKIVSALAVQLTAGEQEQFVREETDNPAAYDAFLQGWDHYKRRTPDSYAKAVPYFEKAVALDPKYGRAYAALASTFWESWERGWHGSLGLSRSEARDSAKQLLKLAMDNPTPLAHQVASEMHRQEREYDKAIAEAERAIALDPNDGGNHVAKAGALIVAGRATEAIGHVRTAMRLDPHYPAFYLYVLGVAHFGTGQFEKAAALLQRAVKRNPQNHALLIPLTAAYGHLGREQEAVAAVAQYVKLRGWSAPPSVQRIIAGWPYKDPKDRDRLADGLRKAGLPER